MACLSKIRYVLGTKEVYKEKTMYSTMQKEKEKEKKSDEVTPE